MSASDHLSPDQFGEPFRDPDEPFTYMPDRKKPKSSPPTESLETFDPFDQPNVDPMDRRVN